MKLIYSSVVVRLLILVFFFIFIKTTSFNATLDFAEYIIFVVLLVYYIVLSLYNINFYFVYKQNKALLDEHLATLYLIKFVMNHYVYRLYVSRFIFENVDIVTVRYITNLQVMLVVDPYRNGLNAGLVPKNDIIENINNL